MKNINLLVYDVITEVSIDALFLLINNILTILLYIAAIYFPSLIFRYLTQTNFDIEYLKDYDKLKVYSSMTILLKPCFKNVIYHRF